MTEEHGPHQGAPVPAAGLLREHYRFAMSAAGYSNEEIEGYSAQFDIVMSDVATTFYDMAFDKIISQLGELKKGTPIPHQKLIYAELARRLKRGKETP